LTGDRSRWPAKKSSSAEPGLSALKDEAAAANDCSVPQDESLPLTESTAQRSAAGELPH